MNLHPRAQAVATALDELGSTAQPRMLPESARTAQEAADSLGVEVGAIVKSLVFDCADEPVLILCSGSHQVDTAAVAKAHGLPPLRRAAPDFVKSASGQSIGGVAPVGHPARIRTFIDNELAQYRQVWAAAGHPHAVFPTTFDEMLKLTDGVAIDVRGS